MEEKCYLIGVQIIGLFPSPSSVEKPLKKGVRKGIKACSIEMYRSLPVPFFSGKSAEEGKKKNNMTFLTAVF